MPKQTIDELQSHDSRSLSSEELLRDLRIQGLIDKLEDLSGGHVLMEALPGTPPEELESFLREVLEFEREKARKRKRR